MESLITPLQDRIEDWKKAANQLDKDHAKGMWGGVGGVLFRAGGGVGCFLGCGGDARSHPTPVPAEYKRARHEIKKKSSDTLKLQKKARKGRGGVAAGWGGTGGAGRRFTALSLSLSVSFPLLLPTELLGK